MKEFKQMLIELNERRIQNPIEFYGSIAAIVIIFGAFYITMWVTAILDGRV
jgi:hypothetical protein